MTAQDRTLDQYQELMSINAVSHLIRAARQLAIFDQLLQGQQTAPQLQQALSLSAEPAGLLLDALVAIGIIEQYGDDYALSQAARLLCQYDDDLGDHRWSQIVDFVRGDGHQGDGHQGDGQADRQQSGGKDDQQYFDSIAATQWIHTPAAIQAAEVLDIGGDETESGLRILDIGCGSAVWSCAMAHRDAAATITLVDHPGALEAALMTAASIGLSDRVTVAKADPAQFSAAAESFDLVLLAQRLSPLGPDASDALLAKAVDAAAAGGRVVVIDEFRAPGRPNLAESLGALQLELGTTSGRMRTLEEAKTQLESHQLQQVQFTFLAASRAGLGLAVGVKPG
jgi:ubiquinone/menaquinone biosynthesis C-methylase UbiE